MEHCRIMRLFRLKHGISLTELGQAVGVSHQYLSEIELATSEATAETQALIRKAYETVIAARKEHAAAMSEDFESCKDRLFAYTTSESEGVI